LLTVTHELELLAMPLIKIKVQDIFTTTRTGVAAKTGKAYKMTQQENVFVELNGEIRKIPVMLQENQQPFAAGNYSLNPLSLLRIGRFGFEVDGFKALELIPVQIAGIPKAA